MSLTATGEQQVRGCGECKRLFVPRRVKGSGPLQTLCGKACTNRRYLRTPAGKKMRAAAKKRRREKLQLERAIDDFKKRFREGRGTLFHESVITEISESYHVEPRRIEMFLARRVR